MNTFTKIPTQFGFKVQKTFVNTDSMEKVLILHRIPREQSNDVLCTAALINGFYTFLLLPEEKI